MKNRFSTVLRMLVLSLLLASPLVMFTSCGDDEPKSMVIDYYLNVEEGFLVNGSMDQTAKYYNPKNRMYDAIRQAYPTPDAQGNDAAVIAACDREYEEYVGMYTGLGDHITCVFNLVRATKKGDIIKQNETLKTYVYDINSTED